MLKLEMIIKSKAIKIPLKIKKPNLLVFIKKIFKILQLLNDKT